MSLCLHVTQVQRQSWRNSVDVTAASCDGDFNPLLSSARSISRKDVAVADSLRQYADSYTDVFERGGGFHGSICRGGDVTGGEFKHDVYHDTGRLLAANNRQRKHVGGGFLSDAPGDDGYSDLYDLYDGSCAETTPPTETTPRGGDTATCTSRTMSARAVFTSTKRKGGSIGEEEGPAGIMRGWRRQNEQDADRSFVGGWYA